MIIKHNLTAMNANRQLNIVTDSNAKSTEKLSSGYKINRAADDAAGLAISEKMRRQIRGLNQGIKNTQDGISLCQVADGALAEVHDMLHRITELAVKAANGTNSQQDREAMQQEISELLTEVDRVGDTTTFNEMKIFKGMDISLSSVDETPETPEDPEIPPTLGDIPFTDFTLADLDLGKYPFGAGSVPDHLQLQAIVNKEKYKDTFKLIYGDGDGTSHSSVRLDYSVGTVSVTKEVPLSSLTASNYTSDVTSDPPGWTRDFRYQNDDGVEIVITQKVTADSSGTKEKNYGISYSIANTGTVSVGMDFQFHVDTAYNNNDRCEGYFVEGQRLDKACVYSETGSKFTDGQTNANIHQGVPDSVSIIDVDRALAFSEKITFGSDKPDSFSFGTYSSIYEWSYYDDLNSRLGQNMIGGDLGFSLLWHDALAAGGGTANYSFNYGIAAVEQDDNLKDIPVTKNPTPTIPPITSPDTIHYGDRSLWIQSGGEAGDGLWVQLGEMNTTILGIKELNVSTMEGACEALDLVADALNYISSYRSRVGAQQNRMEHTVDNENNIVENTTSAESLIRDTNMADEMVRYSQGNILAQAGQAMLAQANNSKEGVLSLLQ